MRCNECAHENPEGSKFCSACGTSFDTGSDQPPEENNIPFEENPYQAPHVNVEAETEPEIPSKVLSRIKGGWIAGIVSATITLIFTLIAMNGTNMPLALDAWSFIDVGLFLILSYGVYKKSRTAAVLLFLLFLANKIFMVLETGKFQGWFMALIFLYFYFMAIVGTFQYHHILKKNKAA
jgi:serine/threonine-protein kinase